MLDRTEKTETRTSSNTTKPATRHNKENVNKKNKSNADNNKHNASANSKSSPVTTTTTTTKKNAKDDDDPCSREGAHVPAGDGGGDVSVRGREGGTAKGGDAIRGVPGEGALLGASREESPRLHQDPLRYAPNRPPQIHGKTRAASV